MLSEINTDHTVPPVNNCTDRTGLKHRLSSADFLTALGVIIGHVLRLMYNQMFIQCQEQRIGGFSVFKTDSESV